MVYIAQRKEEQIMNRGDPDDKMDWNRPCDQNKVTQISVKNVMTQTDPDERSHRTKIMNNGTIKDSNNGLIKVIKDQSREGGESNIFSNNQMYDVHENNCCDDEVCRIQNVDVCEIGHGEYVKTRGPLSSSQSVHVNLEEELLKLNISCNYSQTSPYTVRLPKLRDKLPIKIISLENGNKKTARIGASPIPVSYDSGAMVSLWNLSSLRQLESYNKDWVMRLAHPIPVSLADGRRIIIEYYAWIPLQIGRYMTKNLCYLYESEVLPNQQLLLGLDYLAYYKILLICDDKIAGTILNTLRLSDIKAQLIQDIESDETNDPSSVTTANNLDILENCRRTLTGSEKPPNIQISAPTSQKSVGTEQAFHQEMTGRGPVTDAMKVSFALKCDSGRKPPVLSIRRQRAVLTH